jgi:hypothetical protein
MIKKWNNFVKESVDYKSIESEIDKIINDKFGLPEVEKKRHLISIFENDLKLEDNNAFYNNHITKALNIYTEYMYNDKSKEIKKILEDIFTTSDKWLDTTYYTNILFKKSVKEIKEIILKLIDLYDDIKKDFNNDGYPKQSDLSKKVESICLDSLDDSTLEFFDVVESYSNLHIELGYDKDNLNLELLQRITDEVSSVCGRISDSTGLKNTFVEFDDNLLVGFEF